MSWKEQIQTASPTWHGLTDYVRERTADLTSVCVAPESTEVDIRRAQASILELNRLLSLPAMIQAEGQIRGQMAQRKGY